MSTPLHSNPRRLSVSQDLWLPWPRTPAFFFFFWPIKHLFGLCVKRAAVQAQGHMCLK